MPHPSNNFSPKYQRGSHKFLKDFQFSGCLLTSPAQVGAFTLCLFIYRCVDRGLFSSEGFPQVTLISTLHSTPPFPKQPLHSVPPREKERLIQTNYIIFKLRPETLIFLLKVPAACTVREIACPLILFSPLGQLSGSCWPGANALDTLN